MTEYQKSTVIFVVNVIILRSDNMLAFPSDLEKLKDKISEYRKNKTLNISISSQDLKEFLIVLAGVALGSAIGNIVGKSLVVKLKKAVAVLLS